jgi:hypothetical protein
LINQQIILIFFQIVLVPNTTSFFNIDDRKEKPAQPFLSD